MIQEKILVSLNYLKVKVEILSPPNDKICLCLIE